MRERIRQLRKQILNLNQTEFGKKIGIGQQSIANIENGTNTLTERNFEAICRAWSVNPLWLRHGVGEVFVKPKETALQVLVDEFKLNMEEMALIAALLGLPREHRAGVVRYVKEAAAMFETILEIKEKHVRKRSKELSFEEVSAIFEAEINEVAKLQSKGNTS